MRRFDYPVAPLILAMVLGQMMDSNFRQAVSLASSADHPILFTFGHWQTVITCKRSDHTKTGHNRDHHILRYRDHLTDPRRYQQSKYQQREAGNNPRDQNSLKRLRIFPDKHRSRLQSMNIEYRQNDRSNRITRHSQRQHRNKRTTNTCIIRRRRLV